MNNPKGVHVWTYHTNSLSGLNKIEMVVDEETTLDEMVTNFQTYLNASGFSFDGTLDFVFNE